MTRWMLLAAGAAALTLSACDRTAEVKVEKDEGEALRTISKLECPETQGELTLQSAKADGAECVALLPGDCPLLDPRELDRLLTGIPPSYVAIVPDRHGSGTNALVLAPPAAIGPAFGEGSCERHVAAARGAGVPFAVEELPSLALDLDTPADAIALTRALAEGPKRARRTARALGI